VERVEPELVRERERVGGHVAHLVRAVRLRRLPHVAVVEHDDPVRLRPLGDLEDPRAVVPAEAHDGEQRLALAVDLVVQALPVHLGDRHERKIPSSPCRT
jgi:hypothetical protein